MIHLAHDILSGRRDIKSLTLVECIMLMSRFEYDNVRILGETINEYKIYDEQKVLEEAQFGAKIAVNSAIDDDEYWAAYGDRYDDHLNIISID